MGTEALRTKWMAEHMLYKNRWGRMLRTERFRDGRVGREGVEGLAQTKEV